MDTAAVTEATASTENTVAGEVDLSDLSHELRAPLAGIRNYAEILLHFPPDDDDQRRLFLTTILDEAERMTRLLTDMVELERLARSSALAPQEVVTRPLIEVVERAVLALYPLASSKQIEITLDEARVDGEVCGHLARLERAVRALVENAVKFSSLGARVAVRLEQDAETVSVVIDDTGVGVAPAILERLFEPFFVGAVPPDTLSPRGSGLGLALTRAIARLHDGDVSHVSRPQGSRFRLTLPRAQ